jgi:hypothetical protein
MDACATQGSQSLALGLTLSAASRLVNFLNELAHLAIARGASFRSDSEGHKAANV